MVVRWLSQNAQCAYWWLYMRKTKADVLQAEILYSDDSSYLCKSSFCTDQLDGSSLNGHWSMVTGQSSTGLYLVGVWNSLANIMKFFRVISPCPWSYKTACPWPWDDLWLTCAKDLMRKRCLVCQHFIEKNSRLEKELRSLVHFMFCLHNVC